jgi:hypothetical protein
LLLAASYLHLVAAPNIAFAAPVEIPVGTPVTLSFQVALNPETAVIGETVMLTVADDVRVGKTVVIAKGANATAEVVNAQKRGSVGKPAVIQVVLRTVSAVDGTAVLLSGQKQVAGEDKQTSALVITILCCILGLLQKGGDAEIPAGSTVQGTVASSVTIEA